MPFKKEDRIKSSVTISLLTILTTTTLVTIITAPSFINYRIKTLVTFIISSFFTFLFFILTNRTKGFITMHKTDMPIIYAAGMRYCTICKLYKPERSHHCSRCQKCIKKMDHHCPWVAACVNNDNLAYFIRFLFFAFTSCLISTTFFTYLVALIIKRHSVRILLFYFTFLSFHLVFTFLLFGFTISFFIFNIRFVLKNVTLIESNILSEIECFGMTHKKNPYDFGKLRNLIRLMGKPYFLFLFGEDVGDGLSYPKTYDIDRWPPLSIPRWTNYEIDV